MVAVAFWRAWSSWAVSVAATATTVGYTATHPLPAKLVDVSGSGLDGAVGIVFVGAFATVGALLAWKRPGNPIGWLLSAIGLIYATAAFSVFLEHFPRMLTLTKWLGFLYLLGIGLCVFVVLLFPSGNLPSRRWRPVAWAAGAGAAGWVLGCAFAPTIITVSPSTRNPVGAAGPAGDIFKLMALGGAVLLLVTGLAAGLSLVFRYRRAGTAERAQLKWLVYVAVLIVAVLLATVAIQRVMGSGTASNNLQNALSSGAIALVPVAIGVAILRYRLYDINRVISRTVAYTIVTGLLAGIYAGLVLLATHVPGVRTPVAVAAATLAAAALFNPVRRRVQHRVDRRFNRARYDAEATVVAFAARLNGTVDLDSIQDDLASVVEKALAPAHMSVWVSKRG